MSLNYTTETFTKKGRVAAGEKPEEYQAQQLTDDSIDGGSVESIVKDALAIVSNDLAALRQVILAGANSYLKSLAGGTDNYTKAARQLVKLGLSGGKTVSELAEGMRNGSIKF